MAKKPAQTSTGRTRIKNGLSVTLYGAASKGHEGAFGGAGPVGSGLEPGVIIGVPTAQAANALQIEEPEGSVASGLAALRVALTPAQIITLHSAPVPLIPAPGAGKYVFVKSCIVEYTYGTTQYTGGGAVNPVYHGATTNLLSGSVAAATILAAASAQISCGAPATALALSANTGVDLYAAADFAAGDGTGLVKIEYAILPVG